MPKKQLIPLLKSAVNAYFISPVILSPFIIIAFVQLLVIDFFYFSVRAPLVNFFGPIITRLWGEPFLHYPYNFEVIPRLIQYAQYPIYIFINSFYICVAVAIIVAVNNNKTVNIKSIYREISGQYVHIVTAALVSFIVFNSFNSIYGIAMQRAWEIRSTSGLFFMIKKVVLGGAPFFILLIGVIVTTIFALVYPILVIEKKKAFLALAYNFRILYKSWLLIFLIVFIPTLLYIPVLLLRNSMATMASTIFPEIRLLVIILSVIAMAFVDATIYTALSMYYLLKKEA